jgi:hypothetical protein
LGEGYREALRIEPRENEKRVKLYRMATLTYSRTSYGGLRSIWRLRQGLKSVFLTNESVLKVTVVEFFVA